MMIKFLDSSVDIRGTNIIVELTLARKSFLLNPSIFDFLFSKSGGIYWNFLRNIMEAIIKTGGQQYQVSKGQKITVNKLDIESGKNIEFDVLALIEDTPVFGEPVVKGAKVIGKILDHKKDNKVIVTKYKRRKGYHKTQGHRQLLTDVEITDIQK